MRPIKIRLLIILSIFCLSNFSCEEFLDEKSNQSLSTPATLDDLQALTDNFFMNRTIRLNNNMSDEYFIEDGLWEVLGPEDQDSYIWESNLDPITDWRDIYNSIFHYNTILDNLKEINVASSDQAKANSIRGTALFYRAYLHERIAELYAPQYDASSSTTDLGIPLRLSSDFNIPSERSTVKETYDQIIDDLNEAASLLSDELPTTLLYKYRPTKVACYAMLAKVYLQIGSYDKAYEFSNSCINEYGYLLDFNSDMIDTTSIAPFPSIGNNGEIILYLISNGPLNSYDISIVDSLLYQSYSSNDLRKKVYFEVSPSSGFYFKGPYSGTISDLFNGIATDEIYLIRAEASARLDNAQPAMDDLNFLLSKRWKTGTYSPYISLSSDQILSIILNERKKELIDRGTRWSDLRRLNKESSFAVSIRRKVNGQIYELPPNDLRYTLLIPNEVIIKSSLKQNPR